MAVYWFSDVLLPFRGNEETIKLRWPIWMTSAIALLHCSLLDSMQKTWKKAKEIMQVGLKTLGYPWCPFCWNPGHILLCFQLWRKCNLTSGNMADGGCILVLRNQAQSQLLFWWDVKSVTSGSSCDLAQHSSQSAYRVLPLPTWGHLSCPHHDLRSGAGCAGTTCSSNACVICRATSCPWPVCGAQGSLQTWVLFLPH